MAVPLLALALPIADAAFAVGRRLRRGRALLAADREHLHHRLLARGLDVPSAVAGLTALAGAGGCLAWFLSVTRPQAKLWALGGAVAALAIGLRRLRRPSAHGQAAGAPL
jgi:UDP-GlcNAc:undecaprenyl-phosphate GlcNAc-1-phosphate transferase